jgi:protein-S-isoprenylcysteine O-methyltransferase Ste14
MIAPLLKTLLFTILVPGTVGFVLPYSMLPPDGRQLGRFWIVGLALAVIGALIYLRCAWDFAAFGRGTPAPIDPPKKLVARGLYRSVRNPMYVGVLLVIFGQAILFASPILLRYGIGIAICFHLFVVLYEEPTLRDKFGDSYSEYCRSVRRWLPRL